VWSAPVRQDVERLADVVEGQADALRDTDERDAAQDVAVEATLTASGPGAVDQARRLVEANGRVRHAGARHHLADRQLMFHLTSTLLEVIRSTS
jgi:hypothetical protein